jgi:hypothetical protein
MAATGEAGSGYALRLNVDYPEQLDRVTTFFRIFWLIPILIVLGMLNGDTGPFDGRDFDLGPFGLASGAAFSGGVLALAPGAMILFRRKYPCW